MMKRKVALDVGDVRIGVAVSDMLGITANPRETYVRKKDDINADIAYFCEYAKKRGRGRFRAGPSQKYGRYGRGQSGGYKTIRRYARTSERA